MKQISPIRIEVAGIPGSGKTTLAQKLAESLRNWEVDIEPAYGGVRKSNGKLTAAQESLQPLPFRYAMPYALAYQAAWSLSFPPSFSYRNRHTAATKLANKVVRTTYRLQQRTDFLIPDTALSSLVAPFLTRAANLRGMAWKVDVLVVLEVDPLIAYERIQRRARPGDKHAAQSLVAFCEVARRTQNGLNVLRIHQERMRRIVLTNPESLAVLIDAVEQQWRHRFLR